MADWYKDVVRQLLELAHSDQDLFRTIRLAVKHIEKQPAQAGVYIGNSRYTYMDINNRFRISYNFHPNSKQIEIVVLHIIR